MRARAAGAIAFGAITSVVGLALAVGGLVGVMVPVASALAIGAGTVLATAELATLSRVPPSASLVIGGVAAGVVVAFVEGIVEAPLPAVVAGAAIAVLLSSWWRYGEHVIAVEGPTRVPAALAARFWVPARDLALALAGQPLRQRPALPPSSPSRR
jgi:hypothetical protein